MHSLRGKESWRTRPSDAHSRHLYRSNRTFQVYDTHRRKNKTSQSERTILRWINLYSGSSHIGSPRSCEDTVNQFYSQSSIHPVLLRLPVESGTVSLPSKMIYCGPFSSSEHAWIFIFLARPEWCCSFRLCIVPSSIAEIYPSDLPGLRQRFATMMSRAHGEWNQRYPVSSIPAPWERIDRIVPKRGKMLEFCVL
jgi:hypothetical protein